MSTTLPKRGRLLEFSLVAIVISTLAAYLLQALATLQDDSERLAVELTIRNMNSGLYMLQAERLASGAELGLRQLAGQNPVTWLGGLPAGYLEDSACPKALIKGQWCWNEGSKVLFYYPKQNNWIKAAQNMPLMAWRVVSPSGDQGFRPGNFRLQPALDAVPVVK